MIQIKKKVMLSMVLLFCINLFNINYALSNLGISGVKSSSYSNAPSGAEFYSFKKQGDVGFLSTYMNLNNCTLRFYYINKNQKKDAQVVIYRTNKKGKETKWKTIKMKKNRMDLIDFSTGNKIFDNFTYRIVLEKGSDVDIAVTCFDLTDRTRKEHKDKKYK